MPETTTNPPLPDLVRIPDQEALAQLRALSESDLRSMGNEVAWLIRQEFARRFSTPHPLITIEQAQAANA